MVDFLRYFDWNAHDFTELAQKWPNVYRLWQISTKMCSFFRQIRRFSSKTRQIGVQFSTISIKMALFIHFWSDFTRLCLKLKQFHSYFLYFCQIKTISFMFSNISVESWMIFVKMSHFSLFQHKNCIDCPILKWKTYFFWKNKKHEEEFAPSNVNFHEYFN